MGAFFFIKKSRSKQNDRSKPLVISSPLPDTASVNEEGPMIMARSYPDIAARLDTIAARAGQGESGMMMVPRTPPPPPPPFGNNRPERENPFADSNINRPERENPFADNNRSVESQNEDEVPLVLAQSYPLIAAELGAIAGRAQRGEPGLNRQQPPQPTQESRERRGFPFAEPSQKGRPNNASMSGDEGLESPIAPELSNAARRARNVL